jgi:molecular chaperone GrpE
LEPESEAASEGESRGDSAEKVGIGLGTDLGTDLGLVDVAALSAERDEYLAALQRLKADFDNFRKRVVRQREEEADRASSDLVRKLLTVLDTLDLAAAHLGDTEPDGQGGATDLGSQAVEALGQARAQLTDLLTKEGLQRVDETDVVFDPEVHDAVAHAPAEDTDGLDSVVDEVLRSGYRWRGHVLRPAMVRVRG